MHDRGLHQSIVDLFPLRPPLFASPTRRTAVAVDRVGLYIMGVPQSAVRYLNYMALFGVGPWDVQGVSMTGDSPAVRRFALPETSASFDPPRLSTPQFSPGSGEKVSAVIRYTDKWYRTVRILQLNDQDATAGLVRALAPPQFRQAGYETLVWDGRRDDTTLAPPGRYAFHMSASELTFTTRHGDALSRVTVI